MAYMKVRTKNGFNGRHILLLAYAEGGIKLMRTFADWMEYPPGHADRQLHLWQNQKWFQPWLDQRRSGSMASATAGA